MVQWTLQKYSNNMATCLLARKVFNRILFLQVTFIIHFRFEDCLYIDIKHSSQYTVAVCGSGFGHTLVSDLPSCSDFGILYCGTCCKSSFVVTNKGRQTYSVAWNTVGYEAVNYRIPKGAGCASFARSRVCVIVW